jgi:hypothetical protein
MLPPSDVIVEAGDDSRDEVKTKRKLPEGFFEHNLTLQDDLRIFQVSIYTRGAYQ